MSCNHINSLCELSQETWDNVTPRLHQDTIQKINAAREAKKYSFLRKHVIVGRNGGEELCPTWSSERFQMHFQ